ncbi:MAG: hypothetical protein GXP28_08740 [Planctomycetes bacterium]|nr:hypothetical protein [Planctomycetota bacterium]
MSRGWIIGIVCLAVVGSSNLIGWAQEGRPQNSGGLSFSERLTALRETFRREKQEKQSARRLQNVAQDSERKAKPLGTSAQAHGPDTRYRRNTTASKKRVGGVLGGKAFSRQGHYPSPRGDTNPTEAALSSEIIQVATDEESPSTRKSSKTKRKTKKKPTRRSPAAKQGMFDVHEALVGNASISKAEARETSVNSRGSLPDSAVGENLGELDHQPAPIAERPSVKEKVKTRPTARESKPQVIGTLPAAQSRQSATRVLETEQRSTKKRTADPFGAVAEEDFSANPMRSSSHGQSFTAVEQTAPIQQYQQPKRELLLSSKQPVIVSHVEGPRRILVGREATYQITLENTSNTKAERIDAAVRVPEWAEIIEVTSTNGAVERVGDGANGDVFEWQLQEIAARTSATLRLRLIPRSGRPMQLGVQWSQAPVALETLVEVQEPKIEVGLSGPQEVLFGQPQRYRLILRNPGTGVAEQVVVQLIPPGGDEQSATTQTLGSLQPGEVREIELELTAREAGELVMQASVVADGGLSAEAIKKVLCRRPELQIDWRGPDSKYAGTVSAYYLRVLNPGTAMTEPVTVTFELPEGSEFVSASEGHSLEKRSRTISWRLAGLGVDEAQFMQVRCKIDQPGVNQFSVTAQIDSGELSDTKTIEAHIVALADLKLEVTDPQGPLPLGDSALYEIRVHNRGKTAAEGISIVGLFSEGIDPVSVEGAQYTERDGRVIFHPIKSLPADREIVLRIRAKATQAGTHIFRAEVVCQDLDIKLAAEETTRFFEDSTHWENGSWEESQTPYSAENGETVSR